MRAAYFECPAGASGDMFLGAWLDTGIDQRAWRAILERLALEDVQISVATVFKQGIRATKVDVTAANEAWKYDEPSHAHDHGHESAHRHDHEHHHGHAHPHDHAHPHHSCLPHRGLRDIEAILHRADLPLPVRDNSLQAFRLLAEAEGYIHGIPPENVHFHEVGAVDAIVDIVGAMAGWYLAGMPQCYVSTIEVSGGTVTCAHGRMPVPAPAAARLLQGFVTRSSGDWGETVTPTGAAIIRTLAERGRRPEMSVEKEGYGAGSKELPVANVLRIQLGEVAPAPAHPEGEDTPSTFQAVDRKGDAARERVIVLEANIDDMPAEWVAHTTARLLELGALDAWVTPVVMKKGRPGYILHAQCKPDDRSRMETAMQDETTTLGVRGYEVERAVLSRKVVKVTTDFGSVGIKLALRDNQVVNVAPEYEDCRACAIRHSVPLKQVYQAALLAFASQDDEGCDFDFLRGDIHGCDG